MLGKRGQKQHRDPEAGSRSCCKRSAPAALPVTLLPHARGAWETPVSRRWPSPPPLQRSPRAAKLSGHTHPAGRPPRARWSQALTGAQETLRQPSEAARIIRRSIFHVGTEKQRGRGGEGGAGASRPPRSSAAAAEAGTGAGAGAAPAGAREAVGARAEDRRAEREPGRRRRPGPGASWQQQALERRGEEEPPPPAAAVTAAGGDAQGSCLLSSSSAAASIAAAAAAPSLPGRRTGK